MKIYQLFKDKIPEDLFHTFLKAYGVVSLNEPFYFSKTDLVKDDVLTKVLGLKDKIAQYYLPCKAKVYLDNLDINKCITILRQILKLYQLKLNSKQKYVKYKKTTVYHVSKSQQHVANGIKVIKSPATLSFE